MVLGTVAFGELRPKPNLVIGLCSNKDVIMHTRGKGGLKLRFYIVRTKWMLPIQRNIEHILPSTIPTRIWL